MKLGDIAQIKTGLVLSRKKADLEYNVKASYKLLSLKNVSEEGIIIDETFDEFISKDTLDSRYFTSEEDILIRLSEPYTAVYISSEHSGLLIPSYFAIIKVKDHSILPQYLAWYLNTNYVKFELERSQFGTRIPSTNQNAIKNIPIEVTPISKQKLLVELYQLHQREKLLNKKLMFEKERLFKGMTQQLLGGKKNV